MLTEFDDEALTEFDGEALTEFDDEALTEFDNDAVHDEDTDADGEIEWELLIDFEVGVFGENRKGLPCRWNAPLDTALEVVLTAWRCSRVTLPDWLRDKAFGPSAPLKFASLAATSWSCRGVAS